MFSGFASVRKDLSCPSLMFIELVDKWLEGMFHAKTHRDNHPSDFDCHSFGCRTATAG
jgi:hypothetical protein